MPKKRGQNEGSIYRMQDGRWRAAVSVGWKDGKRVRKVFTAKTRGEVQNKLTIALRSRQLGLPLPGERQTVANFLSDWLRECAKPRVRPKTYDSYSWIVTHHLTPGLGRVRLARLNPQQIQTFLNGRRQWDLSPRTIQHIHAVLRIALSQAEKWNLVARNAAALVDTPQVRRPEVQPMTPSEVQLFLDAIGGDRLEALFILAVAVGLRQGEALGLLWDDAVNLDQGTLTVRYALQRVDKQLTLVEPKTLKSRRTLHLPQFLKAALLRHRARQEEERLVAGSRWQETGSVFTSKIGTPLDGSNVTKRFQRLLQKNGMRRMRFHDLRHVCASLLLLKGVHPRLVMETLGHSQISLTMNTYSHVIPALQKEVASQMDEILSPVATKVATQELPARVN